MTDATPDALSDPMPGSASDPTPDPLPDPPGTVTETPEVRGANTTSPGVHQRELADIHRDVDFANRYRLEFIKHTMSLAAAVFVFTVSFMKNIVPSGNATAKFLVAVSWISLSLSLLGGLGHMAGWDRFYISYRDHARDVDAGKAKRKVITRWRRVAMWAQLSSFGVGLFAIAIFCLLNL